MLLGSLLIVIGLAAELAELRTLRHWFDWGWPKRNDPEGVFWVRVIGGRVFVILGLVAIVGDLLR